MQGITNLTEINYKNNPNIIGRDTEIYRIWLNLLKKEKPNILLLGEPGNGKTSLIHQISYLISNKLCPELLHGFQVFELNINDLISGDGYRGVTEKKFNDAIQLVLGKKAILFIDEFHTVQNAGCMANGSTPGLGNTLKPFLTRGDFRVIGATTNKESSLITDNALLRRFTKINVGPLSSNMVKTVIKTSFIRYIGNTKINVDASCIDLVYDLSLSIDGVNPDKAKDIVDLVVANAKLNSLDYINQDFINETFDKNICLVKKEHLIEDIFSND